MRKTILLLPLLLVGCTSNDEAVVKKWKGTTPKISVSMLEKDTDPMLQKVAGDSFINYLGEKDIEGLDDKAKEVLKAAGEPGQPWQGANGAAHRKELVTSLKKAESDSKALAVNDVHTIHLNEAVPGAVRRMSAELVLARCLLEDGDTKGATAAALQAIDWSDKIIFDAKTVQLWQQLHPTRLRMLGAVRLMVADPKLDAASKTQLIEAVKKTATSRASLIEAITRSFSATMLVPAYNVSSLRTGVNVFQFSTKGDADTKLVVDFANELYKGHKTPYDAHEMAKVASTFVVGIVKGLEQPWVDCKKALGANLQKSIEVFGVNPYTLTEANFKDKAFLEKLKAKLATEVSPNGYLHVNVLAKDYVDAAGTAYSFELQDSAIIAAMESIATVKQPGATVSADALTKDPVTGKPFTVVGTTVKSSYVASPDDPDALKESVAKAYPL